MGGGERAERQGRGRARAASFSLVLSQREVGCMAGRGTGANQRSNLLGGREKYSGRSLGLS